MDSWMLNALLAGLAVAVVAGPLGTFVVWRRMAYFGDALAHSSLLGVALGLVIGFEPGVGVVLVAVMVAMLLVFLQGQRRLATDTLLGIISHSALSLGLVVMALVSERTLPLESYLLGDILSVGSTEIQSLWLMALASLCGLILIWRPLLASTVHEELARVEGIRVMPVQLGFVLLLAVLTAMALKIVGALLIASLLLIPAATARQLSRTPEQMGLYAMGFSILAVIFGLWGSLQWDAPAGPSIVVAAVVFFCLTSLLSGLFSTTSSSH